VPLATRFRGVTSREGVVLHGPSGWGEFAPFAEYPPPVAARWLAAAIEAAWGTWPAPLRDEVPVNLIVPELDPVAAAVHVRACLDRDGTTTAKVKVSGSGDLGADEDRVAAVRAALDHAGVPGARIRIDVNGGWSLREGTTRLPVLDRAARGLEYVEQPCESLHDLAALRRERRAGRARRGVRLAADGRTTTLRGAAPCGRPATWSSSSRRRWAAWRGRWRWRSGCGVRPSSPARWTPPSGWLPASRPPLRSRSSTTPAAWAPAACSPTDLTATTTRPEQGRLRPVRTAPRPRPARLRPPANASATRRRSSGGSASTTPTTPPSPRGC
jgi:hypothetical protein